MVLALSTQAFSADKIKAGAASKMKEHTSELKEHTSEVRKHTLENFRLVKKGTPIEEVFKDFGKPEKDIGSGIHIYVYGLDDGSKVWIGCVEKVIYVSHVQGKNTTRLTEDSIEPNAK